MIYVVPMTRPGHFASDCEARVPAPDPSLLRLATSVFYEWYMGYLDVLVSIGPWLSKTTGTTTIPLIL